MAYKKGAVAVAVASLIVALVYGETWDDAYWKDKNSQELSSRLKLQPNMGVAKNLVLAIGDGMGMTTTTAIRVLRGQRTDGMLGEEALLTWDKFPYTGLSKTYCTDMTTTDSAASATAYHCGVKTKYEMVGVDDKALRKQCSTVEAATVPSVLDHALAEGKSVGIVTTDALVGASPSGAYAHSAFRNWRADYELPDDAKGVCKDIARQLVEDNLDIQVLLGGGRKYFIPNNQSDPEYPDKNGSRTDGMDLTKIWLASQNSKGRKAHYVTNRQQFDAATADNTDYLFGMFEIDRVQEETERSKTNQEPSVAEMARRAIEILSKNPKGFYLFLEGANIDIGHHGNRARMALEEGLAFDDAVGTVMNMTSADDTLVIVSADHSHPFSFGGYSRRGLDILSIANSTYYPLKDKTGNYRTVLSYGNGPGFKSLEDRINLTIQTDYYDTDQTYLSAIPLEYDTHGGEDVVIFSSGPMSHLFNGVHEQTFIAYGMSYAACIGTNKEHCTTSPTPSALPRSSSTSEGVRHLPTSAFMLGTVLLCIFPCLVNHIALSRPISWKSLHAEMREAALLVILLVSTAVSQEKKFWYQNNAEELKTALLETNSNVAKNVVLAIGDGMGVSTTTAIRIFRGQQTNGLIGEEALLSWDKFPHTGFSKTYSTNMMVADSASTATAYLCGVKTKFECVGVDDSVKWNDCSTVADASVKSVLNFALEEGKSVGIVTTDALVGGSPSAAYAHSAQRDWQSDGDLPEEARGVCKDIARQLVEDNLDIQVLLGGGRKYFFPNTTADPEHPSEFGVRTDGRNLVKEWLDQQGGKGRNAAYVTDLQSFTDTKQSNPDYLLGMFEPKRMQEETARRVNNTEPSLAEMTERAINILSRNPNGFFLFLEGAAIDKGHHENRARKALEEGLAFDDAVSTVMNMTSTDDTLVVVSADHGHSFMFGGYTERGQSILSVVNNSYKDTILDYSGRLYTILSYAHGPGYRPEDERVNASGTYYEEDREYPALVHQKSAAHAGEDVAIYARGPMSHLFTGVHEQTFIAHGMAYASCIGWDKSHCKSNLSSSNRLQFSTLLLTVAMFYSMTTY
ncbi:uncharacterized protein [Watersipora subatra]|uniref:uncharacterized protein n=1 Tax=Watersipora subatra TaxID=2589382 RepID=UPI00355BC4BE